MKSIEVVAAIIERDGSIFATERGYGEYKGWWEFPGGKIEPGEASEQALIREIHEELAIEISIERHVVTVEYDYPDFHLLMHCYLAHLKDGEPQLLEHMASCWLTNDSLDTVKWLPADDEVLVAIREQEIV